MNYADALQYLNRLGNEVLTMKFGLQTMRRLLEILGSPETAYPSVLVAGTNGKGSVSHFLSSVCTAAGIRTGLYTSPHLVEPRERVRVNGRPVTAEQFAQGLGETAEAIARNRLEPHPTFFETVTATALLLFARLGVRLAVLEVGMGGRLDSTNAVEPILSLITPISYDHEKYLGNSLSAIAQEKAGILRAGKPAVSAPQVPEAEETLLRCAANLEAQLSFVTPPPTAGATVDHRGRYALVHRGRSYQLGLCGEHQVTNARLVAAAVERLHLLGWELREEHLEAGLRDTVVPGVVQWWSQHPPLILDGGHNPQAARALAGYVARHTGEPRTLVFGCMRDKNVPEVLRPLVPLFERVFLTTVENRRAFQPEELTAFCPGGRTFRDPAAALEEAIRYPGTTVVAGSFYLAGAVLAYLTGQASAAAGRSAEEPGRVVMPSRVAVDR